jgi:hypothetical protein
MRKSALCSSSMDGFPFVHQASCITPPSPLTTSSSSPGTGERKASGISSWKNAKACLWIPLSRGCPPPNSTTSPIGCAPFLMRCTHTRAQRSPPSPAAPTTTEPFPYPWHHPHAFSSIKEYLDYYRGIFLEFCGPEYVDELFSCFPTTEAQVYLTHGDLPRNIPVDGSRIIAIIDWGTAGYYPEFWEYCGMHDPGWMAPPSPWACVLARIFPGSPRERENRSCISDPSRSPFKQSMRGVVFRTQNRQQCPVRTSNVTRATRPSR